MNENEEREGFQMCSVTVMVDETPYCVWDWELAKLDRDFLKGIDPTFFEYMAKCHEEHLDREDAQRAALAIRTTYSHAMETLMSLICAVVQAPDCVIGWLHKYRNDELDRVVEKLVRGVPVPTKLTRPDLSWVGLSTFVHKYISLADKAKEQRIREGFAKLWGRIAGEFLDEPARREYNSIKHGLRARSGGFTMRVGLEAVPGVACPPEEMKTIGGSRFGSTFYVPHPIEGVEKCNIRIVDTSRNWLPEMLVGRIHLMAFSMKNILSFLHVVNGGKPEDHEFGWPEDQTVFDDVWTYSPGISHSSFSLSITGSDITPLSKAAIIARYNAVNGNEGTGVGG